LEESKFIPPKAKKAVTKLKKSSHNPTPEVPKDLSDQWGAVQAAATTCNLLQKGFFPFSMQQALTQCIAFAMKMHEQCVEQALKHPQAHLISELKEILEQKQKDEAQSGEKETKQ